MVVVLPFEIHSAHGHFDGIVEVRRRFLIAECHGKGHIIENDGYIGKALWREFDVLQYGVHSGDRCISHVVCWWFDERKSKCTHPVTCDAHNGALITLRCGESSGNSAQDLHRTTSRVQEHHILNLGL